MLHVSILNAFFSREAFPNYPFKLDPLCFYFLTNTYLVLSCARHCCRSLVSINSVLTTALLDTLTCSILHLQGKLRHRGSGNFPRVVQLVSGRAGIGTQGVWLQNQQYTHHALLPPNHSFRCTLLVIFLSLWMLSLTPWYSSCLA